MPATAVICMVHCGRWVLHWHSCIVIVHSDIWCTHKARVDWILLLLLLLVLMLLMLLLLVLMLLLVVLMLLL